MATAISAIRPPLPSSRLPHQPHPRLFSAHPPNRLLVGVPRTGVRLSSRTRPPAVRAAVASTPPPPVTTSSTGIVLVDRSEADKVSRLKSAYLEKVVPRLKEEFDYQNVHEVPKIEKIVVNCGMGDADQNSKGLEAAMKDLALITGQRPVKTRAKKSIASFKLREGATVGIAVTLRGNVSELSVNLVESWDFAVV